MFVALFSFSHNLIVKCDGRGIINIECHSDDCNKSKTSNEECSHCLIINNSILIAQVNIVFNNEPQTFYPSYTNNYNFQVTESFLRPPQA